MPDKPLSIHPFPLIMKRRSYAGSVIVGIKETQEMSDVRYRFVIDMAKI